MDFDQNLETAPRKTKTTSQRSVSPCAEQTDADREAYYRSAPLHSAAAVRHTCGGVLNYRVSQIERRTEAAGTIHIRGCGAFFMKSGAKCGQPED